MSKQRGISQRKYEDGHEIFCGGNGCGGVTKCQPCKNAYMRRWRSKNKMTGHQRKKDNARSYAGVYKRRGKIIQMPCFNCGSEESQMHHHDYNKPLNVQWLCRKCHMEIHKEDVKNPNCSKCGGIKAILTQSYCRKCHAEDMQGRREQARLSKKEREEFNKFAQNFITRSFFRNLANKIK